MLIFQIITDDDLIALVSDEVFQPVVVWKLEDVQACLDSSYFRLLDDRRYNFCIIGWLIQFAMDFPHGQVTCGSLGLSTATVKLIDADGHEHISCSVGTGPVDAAYKAVDLIVKVMFQDITVPCTFV